MDVSSSTLAGSKLRKQLSSTLRESASAPVSSFAVRQLERMGWTPGTGLGKKRDGMTTHIKVTKRQDSAGLGSEKVAAAAAAADAAGEWWKDSLGDTLAKLGGGGNNNSKSSNSSSSKKTFTDEELFAATGGARFGMRAGKTRNLAKWRRAESSASATSAATSTKSSNNKILGKDVAPGNEGGSGSSDEPVVDGKKVERKQKGKDEKNESKRDKKSKKRSKETEEERKERKRRRKEEKKKRKKEASSSDE